MFHELLFPLTGTYADESALPHAIEMARLTRAKAHLVRVLDTAGEGFRPVDPVDWHVRKLEAENQLAQVAQRFHGAGVEVDEVLLEGQVVEHLINYAKRCGADLIVLAGGSGRGAIGALGGEVLWRSYLSTLLVRPQPRDADEEDDSLGNGATPQLPYERGEAPVAGSAGATTDAGSDRRALDAALSRVTVNSWNSGEVTATGSGQGGEQGLARAPRPSTTSGEPGAADPLEVGNDVAGDDGERRERVRYRRILAALDGSKRAECVLSWVRRLAEQHEAHVILAHVVTEPELPRLTPASDEDLELVRRLVERNREEASEYLGDARRRLGVEADTRLLEGRKVPPALHDLVEQEAVDLVVLSAHGYGGESRWPFGDVATNFIGYGRTPLLLVQDMPGAGAMAHGERAADDGSDVTSEQWGG